MTAKAEVTDTELIVAARAGDAAAFGELYTRWAPWVWRYAYSLVGDRHVAEDVTSEAMTAWVRRLHESQAEAAQLAGWLRTVVRNKSADHIRRLTRQRRAMTGVAGMPSDAPEAPAAPLERCETQQQVRLTLASMSEQHQLLLEWKYAEGLSIRQIAERLGATEKAVEASLYRARREFRRRHGGEHDGAWRHDAGQAALGEAQPGMAPANNEGPANNERTREAGHPLSVATIETNPEATGRAPGGENNGRPDVPK